MKEKKRDYPITVTGSLKCSIKLNLSSSSFAGLPGISKGLKGGGTVSYSINKGQSKISLIRDSVALAQAVIATSTKGSHPPSPDTETLSNIKHSHSQHKSSSSVLNHQRLIYYSNTAHLTRTHFSNVKMQIFVKTRKF